MLVVGLFAPRSSRSGPPTGGRASASRCSAPAGTTSGPPSRSCSRDRLPLPPRLHRLGLPGPRRRHRARRRPAQGDIGDTLTTEVDEAAQDKAALRPSSTRPAKGSTARDEFIADSTAACSPERSPNARSPLVVLPGADADLVKATQRTLRSAAPRSARRSRCRTTGSTPTRPTPRRATLGQQLASQASASPPRPVAAVDAVDDVLAAARVLRQGRLDAAARPRPRSRALRTGDLIASTPPDASSAGLDRGRRRPARSPGPTPTAREQAATALSRPRRRPRHAARRGRARRRARRSGPTDAASVISAARERRRPAQGLSTVDDAELPDGQASVVFALLEQARPASPGSTASATGAAAAYPPARRPVAAVRALSRPARSARRARRLGPAPAARTRPPGDAPRWDRTNHARPHRHLLEGPAYAAGARAGASALLGGRPGRRGVAAGAGGLRCARRPGRRPSSKGLARPPRRAGPRRGDHRRWSRSSASAPPAWSRPRSSTARPRRRPPATAARHPGRRRRGRRCREPANLLDLRPGRALKARTRVLALAADALAPPARGRRRRLGAALGLLRPDLAGRAMLGDTGANAAGALLGTALRRAHRPARAVRSPWRCSPALTLASEKVSLHQGHRVDTRGCASWTRWGRPAR